MSDRRAARRITSSAESSLHELAYYTGDLGDGDALRRWVEARSAYMRQPDAEPLPRVGSLLRAAARSHGIGGMNTGGA
jgi:hypothetical protein